MQMDKLLQEQMLEHVPPPADIDEWVAAVIFHRDKFQGCGFDSASQKDAGEYVVFKLVLAINQPRRLVLQKCKKMAPTILPSVSQLPPGVTPDIVSYEKIECWPLQFHDPSTLGFH